MYENTLNVLQKIVKDFELETTVKIGNVFHYYIYDDIIEVPIREMNKNERTFAEYAYLHCKAEIDDIFMLNFLHEVGHAKTLFSWNGDINARDFYNRIEEFINNDFVAMCCYGELDEEKKANKWLVETTKKDTAYLQECNLKLENALEKDLANS